MTLPAFVPAGYTLEQPLGSGTTAHVFRARHPEFGTVALKLPRGELGRDSVLRRMFENEVQITTTLTHPHVVSAFEGCPTGAGAFLALEFFEGTLGAQAGRAVPLGTAYRLVLEVAQGLLHSHARRILHRDVKPANVFMQGGRAKLGDFGTATYLDDLFGSARRAERVGTAFYMAPEVFRGEPATLTSDLYSLGILAYEVISGVRPFTGRDEDALMLAHSSGAPISLRQHRPEVCADVGRVVASAMSRTPEKRFGSADAFVSAFAEATGLPPSSEADEASVGRSSRIKRADDPPPEKAGRLGWFGRKRS